MTAPRNDGAGAPRLSRRTSRPPAGDPRSGPQLCRAGRSWGRRTGLGASWPRLTAWCRARSSRLAVGPERGDVPGWVLITVMTAGLVMLIWALAGPALTDLFTRAVSSVTVRP